MSNNYQNDGYGRTNHTIRRPVPSTRSILGLVFGIFMFLVYEGMGVLMFIHFFKWSGDWAWTRWIVGVVLVLYGFFRGYRTYKDLTQRDDEI